jgi:hypothetical protein
MLPVMEADLAGKPSRVSAGILAIGLTLLGQYGPRRI